MPYVYEVASAARSLGRPMGSLQAFLLGFIDVVDVG
jgi:hypothetical protein